MNPQQFSMHAIKISLLVLSFFAPAGYAESDKSEKNKPVFSLGLGGIYAPKFSGADEYETLPIPVIFIQYNRLTVGGMSGISYDIFRDDGIKAGVALGYFGGRDESDADYLRGMGDLSASADLRIYVRRAFGPFYVAANIQRDFSEDVGGITSAVSAGYSYRVTPDFSLNTNISARWINDDYAAAMFGVTPQQAQGSGLPETNAKAGVESGTLSLTALYSINSRWTLTGTVSNTQFVGDARQSPITREPNPTMFMTSMSYRF